MLHGDGIDIRTAALRVNLIIDPDKTLPWLITECKSVGSLHKLAKDHANDVLEVLCSYKKPEVAQLLQREADKADPDELLTLLKDVCSGFMTQGKVIQPGYKEALEKLLTSLLLNEQRCTSGGSWGHMDTTYARVCDLAAFALSIQFPEQYKYTPTDSIAEEDRQRFAMLNKYRAQHGSGPLNPPTQRNVSKSESCVVSEVRLTGSVEKDTMAAHAALSLRGQVLNADRICSFMKAVGDKWPSALRELTFHAIRNSYGTGVMVNVDFSATADVQSCWMFHESEYLGIDMIFDSGGGSQGAHMPDMASLNKVLASDAHQRFDISLMISHKS